MAQVIPGSASDEGDSRRLIIDLSRQDEDPTLMEMEGEFQDVVGRKTKDIGSIAGKRKLSDNQEDTQGCLSAKKQNRGIGKLSDDQMRRGNSLVVYIKGQDVIITKLKSAHVKAEILKEFGAVNEIELAGESLRVYCKDTKQRNEILSAEQLGKVKIIASEPFFIANEHSGKPARLKKGVVYGIPTDVPEEEIAEELEIMKVERLYRLINGEKQPTLSVALFFKHDQEIPSEVDFRYKVYTVRSFIPSPVRCYACQRFGHIAKNCRSSKLRCPKCTGNHEFKDCGITARDSFKCGNCGGAHSAAHKGCPKFLEAKEVVKESAK